MAITYQNFDWAETARPLVVFIPNYGRGAYIRKLLPYIPRLEDALIIVGNDGLHEEFDDLHGAGVRYFTTDNPSERNGGFIRNYVIRRCQSKLLGQKDPETFVAPYQNDPPNWIERVLSLPDGKFWRPAYTTDVDRNGNPHTFRPVGYTYERIHWCYAAPTEALREIRGYDEDYKFYSPEDKCCFRRLSTICDEVPDGDYLVEHFWHQINDKVPQWGFEGNQLYNYKLQHNLPINPGSWGEG